jgi:hypothetical protein
MENVIGWILAWLPEGGTNYNFEFFQEEGTSGKKCKYDCDFGDGLKNDLPANQRAFYELEMLKSGKAKKLGMKVIDGYTQPIISRITP